MISRYKIGNPIPTDSVVEEIEVTQGRIPYFAEDTAGKSLSLRLDDRDMVFGLGETNRGINKRGWSYTSFNADDPIHTEEKRSLYASQNFFVIVKSDSRLGVYVDTPGRVTFDIGYERLDMLNIVFEDFDADIYLITAPDILTIVKEFRHIIGRSYIPPRWAFGYGQSRWGYRDARDVSEVAERYDAEDFPLDMIYLDIDYMDSYKDFTVSDEAFPDFDGYVRDMRERGIHLVPIIDAGVKIEPGYDIYEEGVRSGYFCKKEDGTDLVAAVWPGKVHFPDFLNDDARKWFGEKYKFLLDKGIEGFWNDMNEPAIFYTEDHLKEVFDTLEEYRDRELDINTFFSFKDIVGSIDNNIEDYRRFYHEYKGKRIRHDKVHNIYGYNMTRAAGEAFKRLCPDKRILMFSRASYIGAHRYGGVWCGDNRSWWSHLLLNIQQMPALNMCGFLYCGADIGGFGGDVTEDLLLRWVAFGIFTPLFRNHSAHDTRSQELYRFTQTDTFREFIRLRYALIPYLYSEYMKAALEDGMLFKPLCFEYDDDRCTEVEDQLLLGESIMIAPVYRQNVTGRYVYLPEDMKLVRFRSYDDYDEEILSRGDHYIRVGLNEIVVFVRRGHVLPVAKPAMRADEVKVDELAFICYEADPADYDMYIDDGISVMDI